METCATFGPRRLREEPDTGQVPGDADESADPVADQPTREVLQHSIDGSITSVGADRWKDRNQTPELRLLGRRVNCVNAAARSGGRILDTEGISPTLIILAVDQNCCAIPFFFFGGPANMAQIRQIRLKKFNLLA